MDEPAVPGSDCRTIGWLTEYRGSANLPSTSIGTRGEPGRTSLSSFTGAPMGPYTSRPVRPGIPSDGMLLSNLLQFTLILTDSIGRT